MLNSNRIRREKKKRKNFLDSFLKNSYVVTQFELLIQNQMGHNLLDKNENQQKFYFGAVAIVWLFRL